MDLRLSRLLLCAALGLVLVLRYSQHAESVFNVDEAVSAAIGVKITEGGVPYRDGVDHRGPLTYYVYAWVFELAGSWNLTAVHIAYAIGICCVIGMLYGLGKEWGGTAAILMAVFSWTLPPEDVWAAHVEWTMIFWTCLAMGCISLNPSNKLYVGLAGLCLGLAILSKQVAVWDSVALGVWLLFHLPDKSYSQKISHTLWAIGGVGTVLLVMGAVAWHRGFGSELWLYGWTYNVEYYLPELTLQERWANALNLARLFKDGALLLVLWGMVGGMGMVISWKRLAPTERLWLCWLIGAGMGVLTSGRDFVHYTIQLLPPLCLVATYGVRMIWHLEWGLPRRVARIVCIGLLLLGMGSPLWNSWQMSQQYVPSHARIQAIPATYIKERTQPEDYLFVWGFATEFYVYAQRRPATRFVYCNMLTGLIPWENYTAPSTDYAIIPGSWDQCMADLAQHPPVYVLDTSPADHHLYGKYPIDQYPRLATWLHQHYQIDTTFQHLHPASPYRLYVRS